MSVVILYYWREKLGSAGGSLNTKCHKLGMGTYMHMSSSAPSSPHLSKVIYIYTPDTASKTQIISLVPKPFYSYF